MDSRASSGFHTATSGAVSAVGSRGKFRLPLTALITAAILAMGIAGGVASAQRGSSARSKDNACAVLLQSNVPALLPPGAMETQILNSCDDGICERTSTDSSGQSRCDYARGATLTLGCHQTAKQALVVVQKEIRRGYRRVNVGANLAGIAASQKFAAVFMAYGRAVLLFDMGASSDTNPNPTWPGVKGKVLTGARDITKWLRRNGVSSIC